MKTFFTAFALTGFLAGAASAATVVETGSVSATATNWTDSIAIDQFDASLGTLTSVTIELSGSVTGSSAADNESSATTVTLDTAAQITATGPGASFTIDIDPTGSSVANLAADDNSTEGFTGAPDFAGSDSAIFTGVTGSDDDSAVITSGLAAFIGGGTFNIDLAAVSNSVATGSGNFATFFFDIVASADVEVTYEFTPTPAPVPLPAGMPLLLAGLGAFAIARRRKS